MCVGTGTSPGRRCRDRRPAREGGPHIFSDCNVSQRRPARPTPAHSCALDLPHARRRDDTRTRTFGESRRALIGRVQRKFGRPTSPTSERECTLCVGNAVRVTKSRTFGTILFTNIRIEKGEIIYIYWLDARLTTHISSCTGCAFPRCHPCNNRVPDKTCMSDTIYKCPFRTKVVLHSHNMSEFMHHCLEKIIIFTPPGSIFSRCPSFDSNRLPP